MASKALKFTAGLKELRIHLCQKSPESQGVRDFLEHSYVSIKQNNPKFPILVRECHGVMPKAYARYEFGKENSVNLTGKNSQQVLQEIEKLACAQ